MFEGLFQPMHLVVILAIVLLLFGPSKLAGLGKGLGDAIRGFKNSMREGEIPAGPPSIDKSDTLASNHEQQIKKVA